MRAASSLLGLGRMGMVADRTDAEELRSESWLALRRMDVDGRTLNGRVAGFGVLEDLERRDPKDR